MADAHTPYWQLVKPEVGNSRDTWGTKLNADLDDLDALLQALQPIGAITDFAGANAPTGWLLCDGSLKNVADFPRLFAVISNLYGGDGVTTFGVPDLRTRVTAGVGTAGGDQGAVITLSLGQKLGDYQIALTQANMPNYSVTTTFAGVHGHAGSLSDITGSHAHNGGTDIQGDHAHYTTLPNLGTGAAGGPFAVLSDVFGYTNQFTSTTGAHWHNFFTDAQGLHQHALSITNDGNHQHSFTLGGSGAPVRVMQPTQAVTKIICCGPPSMQSLASPASPPALLASPMRGVH